MRDVVRRWWRRNRAQAHFELGLVKQLGNRDETGPWVTAAIRSVERPTIASPARALSCLAIVLGKTSDQQVNKQRGRGAPVG